jgi:flagella basal body P-ring formation protein FlgA
MDSEFHVFSGRIYKVGLIRYVDVPTDISRKLDGGAHVPVAGTVEGMPLRSTLVSRGRGSYRLAIHGDIRKKLRADAGAFVEVAIQRDEESREPQLPPPLVLALRNAPKAQRIFRKMTTALRRQIVRYLTAVKSQATLERRVVKFVARLERQEVAERKAQSKKKKARG